MPKQPGIADAHTEMPSLQGRRAVITGGTIGIGREQSKMLRAEDIAVALHFMLRQPRRCAVSLMRVETRLDHP